MKPKNSKEIKKFCWGKIVYLSKSLNNSNSNQDLFIYETIQFCGKFYITQKC